MARMLLPLPDRDFDVTEVAVPWKLLREAASFDALLLAGGHAPGMPQDHVPGHARRRRAGVRGGGRALAKKRIARLR